MHRRRKFVSARLKDGEYDEKPWLTGKDDPNYKRKRWEKLIFWIGIAIGVKEVFFILDAEIVLCAAALSALFIDQAEPLIFDAT